MRENGYGNRLMIGLCSWGSVLSIRLILLLSPRHEGMPENPPVAGMPFPFWPGGRRFKKARKLILFLLQEGPL